MAVEARTLDHWRQVLARHWPLAGAPSVLYGEHDLNLGSGELVVKVMRPGIEDDALSWLIACHQHLVGTDLPVPALRPANDGDAVKTIEDPDGRPRLVWAIRRLPGVPLAGARPWDAALSAQLGERIAQLHDALAGFDHPALPETHAWDLRGLPSASDAATALAGHPLAEPITRLIAEDAAPAIAELADLPSQPIHNDLNDHNLLVTPVRCGPMRLSALIDFGDMLRAPPVLDLAIAAAYLLIGAPRPWPRLRALIAGYCARRPLDERSLRLLWPLALGRLAHSALHAWRAHGAGRDDPYLQVSQRAIGDFVVGAGRIDRAFIEALVARAGGCDHRSEALTAWLAAPERSVAPVFETALADAPVLDLSIAGAHACDNPVEPDLAQIDAAVRDCSALGTQAVLGRYAEPRLVYGAPFYLSGEHGASDRRTVHIAVDVFLPAGTPVHSPLPARVHSAEICDADYDYGGLVVLRHDGPDGMPFFTLYGHLAHASVRALAPAQAIGAGEAFAVLGEPAENGGWPPHVHFQLGLSERPGSDWPGVVDPDDADDWRCVFPDPSLLLGVDPDRVVCPSTDERVLRTRRGRHSPPSLRTSYREPLAVARGWRSLLFDPSGRTYLDAYNNVPHVGHAHPRVRRAVDEQMRFVNTNTRYLQPIHAAYTEALARRMPDGLDVVFLLSSGSEANELALRLARTATGRKDTLVLAAGYHGHTVAALDISDYKFSGPGGDGAPDWVHVVANPDAFRAGLDPHAPATGERFAGDVLAALARLRTADRRPACFIAETFPSVGGQLVPPPGYLPRVYDAVRAAGGLCVADEVQTGLGRLGRHFWGFEQQQAVPDIVVLGKPLGNGYPLAAVVTRRDIAERFDTGMEFFATFGGSSVACAAGLAVLSIIDDEALMQRADDVGGYLLDGLRALAGRHPLLADVRGMGLFIGVEIADERRAPLAREAAWIVERLRQQRVLIGLDGPDHNVLKIRPPLCFSRADADHLLAALERTLGESALA